MWGGTSGGIGSCGLDRGFDLKKGRYNREPGEAQGLSGNLAGPKARFARRETGRGIALETGPLARPGRL